MFYEASSRARSHLVFLNTHTAALYSRRKELTSASLWSCRAKSNNNAPVKTAPCHPILTTLLYSPRNGFERLLWNSWQVVAMVVKAGAIIFERHWPVCSHTNRFNGAPLFLCFSCPAEDWFVCCSGNEQVHWNNINLVLFSFIYRYSSLLASLDPVTRRAYGGAWCQRKEIRGQEPSALSPQQTRLTAA